MKNRFALPRPTCRISRLAVCLCLAAVLPGRAFAVTSTWVGGGSDGNWTTLANWADNRPPQNNRDTALIFTGTAQLNSVENITSNFTLNSLTFDPTAGAFTISGRQGIETLSFANSSASVAPTLTQNSNVAETINLNLGIDDGLTVGGTGTGTLTLGGVLSRMGRLTVAGPASGSVLLTGANTYTGGTAINGGTLSLGSANALGTTGTISFGGGTLQSTSANATDYSARFSTAASQSYSIDTNSQNVSFATALTSAGGSLAKLGAGTLTLPTLNPYTGATNVGAGTLDFGTAGGITGGGAFTVDGTFANAPTATLAGTARLSVGSLTVGKTSTGTFSQSGGTNGISGALVLGNQNASTGYQNSQQPASGAYTLTGGTLSEGSLTVANGGGGTFTQNGGTNTVAGALVVASGAGTSTSTAFGPSIVVASAGMYTLNVGSVSEGSLTVGDGGNGTFTQGGGTNAVTGALLLANGAGVTRSTFGSTSIGASTGAYTLSAGSVSEGGLTVGNGGSGTFTQSGGTNTVAGALVLAAQSGTSVGPGVSNTATAASTGTYTLNAGSLLEGNLTVGYGGSGTFTQHGGTNTDVGTLVLGSLGGASAQYSVTYASSGTYNLDGGVFRVNQITGGAGGSTFNLSGGTLRAGASDTPSSAATTFFAGVGTAAVQAGGAIIDTNSFSVTVAQNLLHDTTLGTTADGGLTKLGAGTLTLAGADTFTGPLNVNGGTLLLTGTNTFGSINLNAGTLGVAAESFLGGTGGSLTLNGGGRLLFTADATLGRIYNLGTATLAADTGRTLTFAGSIVNGGYLGAGGALALGDGSTFNATTFAVNSTATATGAVTFNNATLRGALNQTGGTINATDTVVTSAGSLSVGGVVTTNGVEIDGVTAIGSGGAVAANSGDLVFGGGSRTTVNAGGKLLAAAGTTIQLNGALLVNNGTQSGKLYVNYLSTARGTGFFGNVTVGSGGQFGNNGVAGGGTPNATARPVTGSPFWNALLRPAANPLPFIGPQASTVPQVTNVTDLTLLGGGTFNFNLQNTQEPAGVGYDLTNVGNQLTLTASAAPGNQIIIRLIGLDANGNNGTVGNFDPAQGYALTLVHTANGVVGYTAGEFTVNTASFTNGTQGGSFSVVQQGNDLVLLFTPVPEPGTWTLLCLGAVGLLFMVRRRRWGC